jgi:hypothetical protein
VYDAAVAIGGRYKPYMIALDRRPTASMEAAVATAAHRVLVRYFPFQQPALDGAYLDALAAIPEGAAKTEGISVGEAAANGIIASRQDDGLEADIGFTMPSPAPGVWALPDGVAPQTPWMSKLRPFMLLAPDQFRPGPPPDLGSSEWAIEFNEVKDVGGSSNADRSSEQTDIARFFSSNAIVQYNDAFKHIVQDGGLDAVEAARLYAMGNMVAADAAIACMEAKYHYLFWRPQFSVPLADADGNPATVADKTWTPLLATPNHPEYPAAHGCYTGAQAEVLTYFLGTNEIELELASPLPNLVQPVRHFHRATELLDAVINARVWGGLHYRESVIKGVNVGRKVAHWVLARYFLPAD